jgi:signal transduction histidine kinase/CheY-like chemotaxis protein
MAEMLISPLRSAAEARGVAPATAQEPTATILVCDDHAEIVDMLVSVLQLEGFQPIPAYCGADALHAVQQRHIDLVLLDKAMPDIDGFEVCRRIKEMFALRFLPVILVTAKAHKQDKLAGLSLGADDYITKPFDLEELLAKVRVMLRIKHVEDQLFQRNIELASFNAVAGVIGESLILEEMLHNSLAEILRLMDLPAGWIFLWDEQAHTSRLAVYRGVDAERASSPLLYATDLLYQPGGTAATRHECDWLDAAFRARNGLVACISIPLKSKGRVLGFMNLASRHPGAFQPRGSDLQVLESLGFELGVAVEHALLYQDARHMVEQLREVDRLKSRFISTASHEFRTPLSIIKGFANLLMRKETFGFDDETEKQYLRLIDSQIDALTILVEDMLSASRIESGHAEVQAQVFELAPLIERTAMPAALQARHRDIAITIEPAPGVRVRADPRHVEQTVSNLLSNAVKYSDNGTAIRVCMGVEDGMARVDVIDQGVGISPAQLPRLFERFTRLENRRSIEAGGTGLGLYIAKHWVEANGGRIWAESSPEKGSTFSFTLPVVSSQ